MNFSSVSGVNPSHRSVSFTKIIICAMAVLNLKAFDVGTDFFDRLVQIARERGILDAFLSAFSKSP